MPPFWRETEVFTPESCAHFRNKVAHKNRSDFLEKLGAQASSKRAARCRFINITAPTWMRTAINAGGSVQRNVPTRSVLPGQAATYTAGRVPVNGSA